MRSCGLHLASSSSDSESVLQDNWSQRGIVQSERLGNGSRYQFITSMPVWTSDLSGE